MRINELVKKDADSIFMYFEMSSDDLTVLKKYDICLEECIHSATNKVHAHFGRLVNDVIWWRCRPLWLNSILGCVFWPREWTLSSGEVI